MHDKKGFFVRLCIKLICTHLKSWWVIIDNLILWCQWRIERSGLPKSVSGAFYPNLFIKISTTLLKQISEYHVEFSRWNLCWTTIFSMHMLPRNVEFSLTFSVLNSSTLLMYQKLKRSKILGKKCVTMERIVSPVVIHHNRC